MISSIRKCKKIGAAAMLSLGIFALQGFCALIEFAPAADIDVGGVGNVDVVISGLSASEDLAAYDFTVNFNPAILKFESFNASDYLGSVSAGEVVVADPVADVMKVSVGAVSLASDFSTQPGAFSLGTFSFRGLASGISELLLSDVILGDSWGNNLAVTVGPAGTVSAVPEPASLFLCATGIIGCMVFAGYRRRFV
jgi:hypothetical protein